MSGKPRISITKEYLEREYSECRKTTTEIAAAIGCSINTINARLKHFGIKLRKSWDRERESLVGRDFNKWHVVKQVASKRKVTQWLCQCECGTQRIIHYGALTSGKRIQCRSCSAKSQRSPDEITETIWGGIIKSALSRDIRFDISKEFGYSLFLSQDKKCALTGLPIQFAETMRGHGKGETTASLDRIDSKKAYEIGNVQWIHKDVNRMKWAFEEPYFKHLCELVCQKSSTLEKSHEVASDSECVVGDGRYDRPCTAKANI